MTLLTWDAKRYRTYYPKLELVCPWAGTPTEILAG